MRYADYYDCETCNGLDIGMSLFIQGCPFHCKGCFNESTWDYDGGKPWNSETESKFLKLIERPYIKRISIVGGSPLCDNNVIEVLELIKKIRNIVRDKKAIWVYTGYKYEDIINGGESEKEIARRNVLDYIDILVDGQFIIEKKDTTLPFRGSSNQRIIDVKESFDKNKPIEINIASVH